MTEDELVDLLKWQARAMQEPYVGVNTQIMVEIVPDLIAEVRQLAVQNELLGHCVTGFELLLSNPDLTDDERWEQMIEHQKQIPQGGEDMYSVLMCKMEDNQAEVRRLQTENAKLEEQCHPSRYHDVEEYYRETTGD